MTEKEFYLNICINILGEYIDRDNSITVVYFDFDESKQELIAGTCTNYGIKPIVTVPYDNMHHIDDNVAMLHEMLTEKGYVLID